MNLGQRERKMWAITRYAHVSAVAKVGFKCVTAAHLPRWAAVLFSDYYFEVAITLFIGVRYFKHHRPPFNLVCSIVAVAYLVEQGFNLESHVGEVGR